MKKILLLLIVCLYFFLGNAQAQPTGLNVNDKAPEFSAKDQNGKLISLNDQLKNGKVVLVFYRGQWCPFCNKQLKNIEDSLSFITSKGATLFAVTPEQGENVSKTIEKTKATYSILSDDSLQIMKAYDVAYSLDATTLEKFKGYGIDLSKANGNNGSNLPVPTVYIIDKSGNIIYKHFDPDYTKRPSVREILDHL